MPDKYPDSHNSGAAKINSFIYRRMGEVIANRQPGERFDNPDSPFAQVFERRALDISRIGVDHERILAVSAIAHIDLSGQQESFIDSPLVYRSEEKIDA